MIADSFYDRQDTLDWMADMKRMGRNGLIVAAVMALAAWGSGAQASVLQVSYKFQDNNVLGILAEGTLQANNNIFVVSKVDQLYGNGVAALSDPGQVSVTAGFNFLSLNGTGIKFQVTNGIRSILADIETSGTVYTANPVITTYGASLPIESEGFVFGSYSASVLPEPATAGLLGVMLLGFGAVRRRFGRS